jgi:serine protease
MKYFSGSFRRERRAVAVVAVFVVLGIQTTTAGCEVLEEILRAGVRGTVMVPEAAGASARQTLAPALAAIRQEVARVAREHPSTIKTKLRRRAPGQGPAVTPRKEPVQEYRPAEVIVRAIEPIRERKAEISRALSAFLHDDVLVDVRLCGTETRCLADLRTPEGKPLDAARTLEVVEALGHSPLLRYAEKNLVLRATSVFPSDEYYTFQWHYAAIDVPAAWEVTTGSADVVAAVIDTGVVLAHPDLQGRVVGGVDLIDDPAVANDGDGRDDDGDDVGDNACGANCHSHHGTHVAGTMGAATDNGTMVSGITWAGGLLAVRVLGEGGGSLADIADGIEWSVGNPVDDVARNARPASVLNLSLGGVGESAVMNEAIADAVASGAIVIVAAGNDNVDAADFTPANAPDAITVAAVGNGAGGIPEKASYSNYGDRIDLAGPGGEQALDNDGDGNGDGVLSTVDDFVVFYQGTSMAAPHVAGVAMLMKSVNPSLGQEEARSILTNTAEEVECDAGCGAGQVNAWGAVAAAAGNSATGLSMSSVRLARGVTEGNITVKNRSDGAVDVRFSVGGADRAAVTLSTTSARIPAGGRFTLTATIARNEEQDDQGSALVTAVGAQDEAEARVDWTSDAAADVDNVTVGAVRIKKNGDFTVAATTTTSRLDGYAYALEDLDAGEYLIVGLLDADNNGSFDDAVDGTGFYVAPAPDGTACTAASCGHIRLVLGEVYEGADFLVAPGFTGGDDVGGGGEGGVGAPCDDNGDCGGGLYCEATFDGGYCTTDCYEVEACPSGSTCFGFDDNGDQICFLDCAVDTDCGRDSYRCDFLDGVGSCIPR